MMGFRLFLIFEAAALVAVAGLLLLLFKRTRRWGIWLAGGSLVVLIGLGCLFHFVKPSSVGNRQFSQGVWAAGAGTGERVHLIDSLLNEYQIKGMDRRQLVGLIGEPTQTSYFSNWDMVYWLGPERPLTWGSFSIDSEWLVIDLDSADRVAKFSLVRD